MAVSIGKIYIMNLEISVIFINKINMKIYVVILKLN